MCGLFGVVCSKDADKGTVSQVFLGMGVMSESRGRDAAGVAGFSWDGDLRVCTKKIGTFRSLWTQHKASGRLLIDVAGSHVLMGHTRASSVGNPNDLRNAHPFQVGPIVGCHNGTMSRSALVSQYELRSLKGSTDSEAIVAALAAGPADPESYLDVVTSVSGSAALSVVDTRRQDAVVLVRGQSSPLAVARAVDGSVWWASVPEWFGAIGRHFQDYFELPEIVKEYSTVTVSNGATPEIRRSKPLSRLSALRSGYRYQTSLALGGQRRLYNRFTRSA